MDHEELKVSYKTYYWFCPKYSRTQVGTVIFRSKDYLFKYIDDKGEQEVSFGPDLKASNLTDYGFYIETFDGEILEYHIQD